MTRSSDGRRGQGTDADHIDSRPDARARGVARRRWRVEEMRERFAFHMSFCGGRADAPSLQQNNCAKNNSEGMEGTGAINID